MRSHNRVARSLGEDGNEEGFHRLKPVAKRAGNAIRHMMQDASGRQLKSVEAAGAGHATPLPRHRRRQNNPPPRLTNLKVLS